MQLNIAIVWYGKGLRVLAAHHYPKMYRVASPCRRKRQNVLLMRVHVKAVRGTEDWTCFIHLLEIFIFFSVQVSVHFQGFHARSIKAKSVILKVWSDLSKHWLLKRFNELILVVHHNPASIYKKKKALQVKSQEI